MVEVKEIDFVEFEEEITGTPQFDEGLVLLGCDDSEGMEPFITGISEFLKKQEVTPTDDPDELWDKAYKLTTTGERHDLALTFQSGKFNMGKFAIVRLGMGGGTAWISDYLDNYADHH